MGVLVLGAHLGWNLFRQNINQIHPLMYQPLKVLSDNCSHIETQGATNLTTSKDLYGVVSGGVSRDVAIEPLLLILMPIFFCVDVKRKLCILSTFA